ncbi:hypothetical protein Q5752_003341 [Cryptotrichosporon argae]
MSWASNVNNHPVCTVHFTVTAAGSSAKAGDGSVTFACGREVNFFWDPCIPAQRNHDKDKVDFVKYLSSEKFARKASLTPEEFTSIFGKENINNLNDANNEILSESSGKVETALKE